MCLPLVARICAVAGDEAEVELLGDGRRVRTGLALFPEAAPEQHVLVDRGQVVELISAEEAESMLAFYTELAETLEQFEELPSEESSFGEAPFGESMQAEVEAGDG